jgi:hypothetical protein
VQPYLVHSVVHEEGYSAEVSLRWGFKCSTKLKNYLKNRDIEEAQKALYDIRESIKDALFLLGFRGEI